MFALCVTDATTGAVLDVETGPVRFTAESYRRVARRSVVKSDGVGAAFTGEYTGAGTGIETCVWT